MFYLNVYKIKNIKNIKHDPLYFANKKILYEEYIYK